MLSDRLDAGYIDYPYSRLLIDVYRTPDSPNFFSKYSEILDDAEKNLIINKYYDRFRTEVSETINDLFQIRTTVVHISVHSFIPTWQGKEREVDIGLLHEDSPSSLIFCNSLKNQFSRYGPEYRVKENEPFILSEDELIRENSKNFGDRYIGIQLEVNQKLVRDIRKLKEVKACLFNGLSDTMQYWQMRDYLERGK